MPDEDYHYEDRDEQEDDQPMQQPTAEVAPNRSLVQAAIDEITQSLTPAQRDARIQWAVEQVERPVAETQTVAEITYEVVTPTATPETIPAIPETPATPVTPVEEEVTEELPAELPECPLDMIVMTRAKLGRSRKPWLRDCKFRIFTTSTQGLGQRTGFLGNHMAGHYPALSLGWPYSHQEIMTNLNAHEFYYLYVSGPIPQEELDKKPKPDPNKPKRRCNILTLVGSTVVEMLKAAPNNGTFRAKLMAIIGEMPPKEADTFNKIKDWVEFNFPKTKATANPEVLLNLRVTFNEIESGRCRYNRNRSGASNVKITPRMIRDALEGFDQDGDFSDFIGYLNDTIRDSAVDNCTDYEVTNTQTDTHEPDNTEVEDVDYSVASIKAAVRDYIILNLPDSAQELGLI